MIALFDDFGSEGPYVGQVKAVIEREHPGTPVIDLQHDAPAFDPRASAYLLAALLLQLPRDTVVLAVVDPGVGTGRRAAVVRADGRWLVGPDNGLFNVVLMRSRHAEWWDVTWRPRQLSSTFHGRDLFAPVAARLHRGEPPPGEPVPPGERLLGGWPDDLDEVIYIDRYGNAVTGMRAERVVPDAVLHVAGQRAMRADHFEAMGDDRPCWYVNSLGLVEFAMRGDSVARRFALEVGTPVSIAST